MNSAGKRGLLARGYARSYGDVCLNEGGEVVSTLNRARIHSYDTEAGTLVCDAGTSYRAIMQHCLPHGWHPPACPGTAQVSMGGAIANDVHGKNQHLVGSFGDHIDWFDLRLPDGALQRVTPDADPDLYAATVGGIGLTGVIETVQLRLQRAPSNAMLLKEVRIPNLDAFLEQLRAGEETHEYAVGWIDALTTGPNMGRGILELASPAQRSVAEPSVRSIRVPFEFPSALLNRHTVRAFNAGYLRRVPLGGRERPVHVNKFLYPLDAIRDWNRLYGTRGVYQFQCAVPFAEARTAIIELMEEILRSRGASFLAVLKSFGRDAVGMLSFPTPGFTLAMDFPRRAETTQLVHRLYEIVIRYNGRVYLAKDALLTPEQLRAMYPTVNRFEAVLRRVDPQGRMQSDMSRRLRLGVR